MPKQITDVKGFILLSNNAIECRIKRSEKFIKLKLRTPKELYTLKLDAKKSDDVLNKIKCEKIEL
ncbi:MAG: 60S ribosomal protein L38 [Candidatus Bathyarchaeota archaeon]|nr:60S ribosomal protein L38 [Candidatus Bathyarchaeota archaeon]